ncbi:hypothetical protein EMPS_07855 [Entomortierella parvispora]|uniref:chitinase n=1 Tax=Entomortierella parvispora TaxID=205924 RepID=A0A9P3HFQ9_9FUNG|nr:hypothetical protein EMPS_07855 [Entomortierella parvispora]
MDLSNQCEPSSAFPGTGLLHCPETSAGVKLCQSKGKAIILSLGGAAGAYGFSDDAEARDFAHMIWNLFLGGTSSMRPLDDAILDGVDLDIEGGSSVGYPAFIAELRSLFATDAKKKYYITAAPQCPFPDAYLGATLQSAWVDMVFVQYYNNYCGTQAYGSFNFNFEQWDQWAKTISVNKNVKVFLGVPASVTAANAGYVTIDRLREIMDAVRCKYSSFGGIMMWDLSQAYGNMDSVTGLKYNVAAAQHLRRPKHLICGGKPEPEPKPTTALASSVVPSPTGGNKVPPIAAPQAPMVAPAAASLSPAPDPVPAEKHPKPKPHGTQMSSSQCPVQGGPCEKPSAGQGLTCDGYQFAICDNNRWVMQSCAPGTRCTPSGCDFIDPSKKVKSCLELEQEHEARTLADANAGPYLMRDTLDRMWNWTAEFVDATWEKYLGLEPSSNQEDWNIARDMVNEGPDDAMDSTAEDIQKSFVVPVSLAGIKDANSSLVTHPQSQQQDSQPFLIDFVKLDASQEFISFSLSPEKKQPSNGENSGDEEEDKDVASQAPSITPFRTQVRIRTNDKAISPLWRVSFDVKPGQTVRTSSRGRFRQEGNKVYVTSLPDQEVESSMVVRFVIEGVIATDPAATPTTSTPLIATVATAPVTPIGATENETDEGMAVGQRLPSDEDEDLGGESSGLDTDSTSTSQIPGIAFDAESELETWHLPEVESARFDTIPLLKNEGHS